MNKKLIIGIIFTCLIILSLSKTKGITEEEGEYGHFSRQEVVSGVQTEEDFYEGLEESGLIPGEIDTGFFNFLNDPESFSFRGISGIFSSIHSDYRDEVEERLRGWDQRFCTEKMSFDFKEGFGLLGGSTCIYSSLCGSTTWEVGDDGTSGSTSFVELPSGMVRPTATIQAEKSSKITMQDPPVYLYKITAYVKALYEDVKFNVRLQGDGTKYILIDENTGERKDWTLERDEEDGDGESKSFKGDIAIVKYSKNNYNKVCIVFSKEGDMDTDKVCSSIPQSDYSQANYINSGGDDGQGAGGTSGGGASDPVISSDW